MRPKPTSGQLVVSAELYRPDPDYDRALDLRVSDPVTYYATTSSIARMLHICYEASKAAAERLDQTP